jgi:hypothetical protein
MCWNALPLTLKIAVRGDKQSPLNLNSNFTLLSALTIHKTAANYPQP